MNIGVIGNVIAKIGHRRRVNRREPDGVNAEPAQVIQLAGDTREVSYPIPIAIEKTAWVDLINHARLPPGMRVRHRLFCSSNIRLVPSFQSLVISLRMGLLPLPGITNHRGKIRLSGNPPQFIPNLLARRDEDGRVSSTPGSLNCVNGPSWY